MDLKNEITKILYECDLMYLKSFEVPEDEYKFEANEIVENISEKSTFLDIALVVTDVFNKYFDPINIPSDSIRLKKASESILKLLQKNN
jgi:hypothetical protein